MHRTEIDGVPVLWEQGPPPLRATLTFGAGARDETFRTIGVTHLVEHLAMGALPRVHHDRNASVDLTATDFTACGRPEQLVEFLDGVCRSLTALRVDRIAKEAGVLAAEGGFNAHPTVEMLVHERLGTRGAGLAPFVGPGYDRLTAEHVFSYARRLFVAGNAVLHLTGPPPAGLRLPLPGGPRPVREHPAPRSLPGPTWTAAAVPSVGAALLGSGAAAWSIGMAVLAERLEQVARHEHGLSYQVDGDRVRLGGDTALLAVVVDARDGQEERVAELLWQELQRLSDTGPTRQDVAAEVEAARGTFDDPRYVEEDLARAARAVLFDEPHGFRQQRLAELTEVTPEQVRQCLAAALPTAQLVVPIGVEPTLPGLTAGGCPRASAEPAGRVFRPPWLARAISRDARGIRLIISDELLAQRDPNGDVHVIRWPDVVGVQRAGAERVVFGAGGCVIDVDPELFSDAEAVAAAVDARVSRELCYDRSELLPADD